MNDLDLYDDIELNLSMSDDFVFGTVMRNETAKRLRSMGMTDEQIQFATQLSLEDIKTL